MFKGRNSKRAQSAMEYLMTYGWAILIIAVVLGALFSLGVFSSSSFLGTTCIASSGFECISPVLIHGTAATTPQTGFTATVGQSTGVSWSDANVIFVLSGQGPPSVPGAAAVAGAGGEGVCTVNLNSFSSGQSSSITFNGALTSGTTCTAFGSGVVPSTSTVGASMSGTLWATYQTSTSGSTTQYVQIATVTLKAS